MVLVICLLSGCWEKVEYRGTFQKTAKSSANGAAPSTSMEEPSQVSETTQTVGASDLAHVDSPPATVPTEVESPPMEVSASDSSAMPTSATSDAASPPDSTNTKRAAWILGSWFSRAVLENDLGAARDDVAKSLAEAQAMAESLNISLATLPAPPTTQPSNTPLSREALGHIVEQEKAIGTQLAKSHGDEHDALFRLAVRTNLLRVLNAPGSKPLETLSRSITDLGPRSGLPIKFWQPLLDVLNSGAAPDGVRAAVTRMHANVEQHLATEQQPHG
jgi:hypothetical protein